MIKGPQYCDPLLRGLEQIRTAVKGFADLCLATRPRNLVDVCPLFKNEQPFF